MASLSKNTTYRQMIDLMRSKLGSYNDPMLPDSLLIKKIDLAISNFYAKQIGRDFYQQRATYSLSGSSNPYHVDLSSTLPFPYKIVDVVYKGSGRISIKQVSQDRLEKELQLTNINSNSIFCSVGGDRIDFSFGSGITVVTTNSIEVLYQRQPTLLTSSRLSGKYFTVDTYETLPNGLVECYKLEDHTGYFAGLDMTNIGNVPFVAGKLNNAASFDAGLPDTYLYRSGASITTVNDNFTIAAWVNLSTTSMKGCFGYVGLVTTPTNGWGFGVCASSNINSNGNRLGAWYSNSSLQVQTFGNIGTGWRWVLVERNNGTWNGYVDNALSGTSTTGVPDAPTVGTFIGNAVIPNPPFVSSRVPTALVDNMLVWNKVLSTTEKNDMWNNGDGNPMIEVSVPYMDILDSDIPFIERYIMESIN